MQNLYKIDSEEVKNIEGIFTVALQNEINIKCKKNYKIIAYKTKYK